jgi:hypothetical protein
MILVRNAYIFFLIHDVHAHGHVICSFEDAIVINVSSLSALLLFLDQDFLYFVLQNGRRHLTSSMNEVSRDLVVNSNSKKKQALLVCSSSWRP